MKVRLDRGRGREELPAIVCLDRDADRVIVGSEAECYALSRADSTYPSPLPGHYGVADGLGRAGFACQQFGGLTYDAADMAALLLGEVLETASEHLGYLPESAALTHPTRFADMQVSLLRQAASDAGLYVSRQLPDHSAVALVCAHKFGAEGNVVVVGCDERRCGATVLRVCRGRVDLLAKTNHPSLGARSFTRALYERLLVPVASGYGDWDLNLDSTRLHDCASQLARGRLLDFAQRARALLHNSSRCAGLVELPTDMFDACRVPVCFDLSVSDLHNTLGPVAELVTETARDAVVLAGLTASDIQHVLPVEASEALPLVYDLLARRFGLERLHRLPDPEAMVAQGAALVAAANGVGG
ncbi:MAG: Hsp70 family protein [Armatimonadetes bacterium]|nr:Hsp70 family protein [Armatimonadota bacterium]